MRIKASLLAGLVAGVFASTLAAQPFLVKNTNPQPDPSAGSLNWIPTPTDFGLVGNRLFFSADDGVHGATLWVTDGTDAGTYMVRDINPGSASYASWSGVGAGGLYFFSANDGLHGTEPWVSDGTEQGTHLLADLYPGTRESILGGAFAEMDGIAYFRAFGASTGVELYRSDGTAAGTRLVRDIDTAGSGIISTNTPMVRIGHTLYFSAGDQNNGEELWKTDGTTPGTVRVKDLLPGQGSSRPTQLTVLGTKLVFTANDAQGHLQLWSSDGSDAGTFQITIPGNLTFPQRLCATPVGVFLIARTPDNTQAMLCRTDGTAAGTVALTTVQDSYAFGLDTMGALPNGVVFPARDTETGTELWFSDGTPVGTGRLIDINPGTGVSMPQAFVSAPDVGLVYFQATNSQANYELWRTDGTAQGTFALTDFPPASPFTYYALRAGNGRLYFSANDGVHGSELWLTDGTREGTRSVKDIRPPVTDASGSPDGFVRAGNAVFFTAWNRTTGAELWRTDAHPNSGATRLVKDVYPGGNSAFPSSPFSPSTGSPGSRAAAVGSILYFAAYDAGGQELWRSDGTEQGTIRVADIVPGGSGSSPADITALGSLVIFTATLPGGQSDRGVWRSDGTAAGTVRLPPICTSCGSQLGDFVRYHDRVYFRASSPTTGTELWRTGGAPDGSDTNVIDIQPGSGSSTPTGMVVANDRIIFSAAGPTGGFELWSSQGTPATTTMVRDIAPAQNWSSPANFISTGTRAFFTATSSTNVGAELWVTDGTSAGTHLVREIVTGPRAPTFRTFVASGDRLYFIVDDLTGIGFELWTSDATEPGTHLVADLLPDNANIEEQGPMWLTAAPDARVVFTIPDPTYGYELWISDGTAAGTHLLTDVNPGAASSWPERPYLFDRTLVFSAYEPTMGRELWAYRFAGGPCPCDWDSSGATDSRDFFDFLTDFFNGTADFDGSGTTDSADFFAFLECFLGSPCE